MKHFYRFLNWDFKIKFNKKLANQVTDRQPINFFSRVQKTWKTVKQFAWKYLYYSFSIDSLSNGNARKMDFSVPNNQIGSFYIFGKEASK